MCPEWLQEQLLSWLIEGAEAGRPGFREMLTLTPCDIFPLLRGRTLWLMGDSMMQVRARALRAPPVRTQALQRRSRAGTHGGAPGECFPAQWCGGCGERTARLV